jgi:rod shape-determining protein MreC
VFPRGYPVAQITKVERSASATFALVEARPTANLDRDREVLLAWFQPPVPDEPQAPEAPPTDAAAAPATSASPTTPATPAPQ